MRDPWGREITYLRLSVTDRCDFRCGYCMSEAMTFLPKAELLSLEELTRLCHVFIDMGVKKIRLTGGEPLVRKGVMGLFETLGGRLGSGLESLTLTTNGSQLARFAEPLYAAGVRRVNVSLDTLDEEKFRKITRWGRLEQVLAGLEAAHRVGLEVRVNAVALQGFNDDEIHTLVRWCGGYGFDVCFIEVMPMGDMGEGVRYGQFWSVSAVRDALSAQWTLTDIPDNTGGPARYVQVAETGCRIGFITPLSHRFCESCNRVRVTCTGMLYLCLGQSDRADLRMALRGSEDDSVVRGVIAEAIGRKPEGHDFVIARRGQPFVDRFMSTTGG